MHQHFCDVAGHDYECSDGCECICGLPMEGNDHSDRPVELRACAEHAGQDGLTAEVESDAEEIDFSILSPERQRSRPHCECGCAALAPSTGVGFCLWCDHVYADHSPEIQARHFVDHCPGAPDELKKAERARLAKRGA
jgi:hypothetical protein